MRARVRVRVQCACAFLTKDGVREGTGREQLQASLPKREAQHNLHDAQELNRCARAPCRKRLLMFNFSSIDPEPVLLKRSYLVSKWRKRDGFRTTEAVLSCEAARAMAHREATEQAHQDVHQTNRTCHLRCVHFIQAAAQT